METATSRRLRAEAEEEPRWTEESRERHRKQAEETRRRQTEEIRRRDIRERLKKGDTATLDASSDRTEGTQDWEVRAIIDGGKLYVLRTWQKSYCTGAAPKEVYQGLTPGELEDKLARA